MSTKRGRKKAAPKAAATPVQQQQQHEPEDMLDLQALQDPAPRKPTAPPSPIVAIARQAMSPVVAAAKRAASIAAAALPAIPEAAAVDANSLDVAGNHHDTSPNSPPAAAQHNPFSTAADLAGLEPQNDSAASHDQFINTSCMQQQSSLDDDMELPPRPPPKSTGTSLQEQLKGIAADVMQHHSSILQALQVLALLLLLGTVLRQGSLLRAQEATIVQQHQLVAAQADSLRTLTGELQQVQHKLQSLPDMQQLQDAAASCSVGLGSLNMSQASLHGSMHSLTASMWQLQANISSISAASQLGQKAWGMLEAAAIAASQASTAADAERIGSGTAAAGMHSQATNDGSGSVTAEAAAATLSLPALLQQHLQQQVLAQQLQQSMGVLDSLPVTVKREVQQQLAAQLPPVDLALADCGARVVFHTPLVTSPATKAVTPAMQPQSAVAPSAEASGIMGWVQQHVRQLLPLLPTNNIAALSRWQPKQQQGTQLLSAAEVNNIILRPHPATASHAGSIGTSGSCLPLVLGQGHAGGATPAAVLEIALPQLMVIDSISLHQPTAAQAMAQKGTTAATQQASGWYGTAPGELVIALANSSSCSRGLCSAVGHAAVTHRTNSNSTSLDANEPQKGAGAGSAVLAPGVMGIHQAVQLHAESFASGRAVLKLLQAAAAVGGADLSWEGSGVVADRVVIHVSSSIGEEPEVCMARISVQGRPLDPASFC